MFYLSEGIDVLSVWENWCLSVWRNWCFVCLRELMFHLSERIDVLSVWGNWCFICLRELYFVCLRELIFCLSERIEVFSNQKKKALIEIKCLPSFNLISLNSGRKPSRVILKGSKQKSSKCLKINKQIEHFWTTTPWYCHVLLFDDYVWLDLYLVDNMFSFITMCSFFLLIWCLITWRVYLTLFIYFLFNVLSLVYAVLVKQWNRNKHRNYVCRTRENSTKLVVI